MYMHHMALPFYSYLFKKYKSICSCKDLYMNVHASVRHNIPKLETT